ncbi:PASTA domain-containing protein [uncultured Bacteroides sp.]|uniref:PASTA domain-containing protein n=1 Tax=uncultured Bacteroides sp. TaxID=162156 RepID=UPI0025DFB64E|nr:PASTA domain-containing protein [uncultured Bacteroides sp.]
MTFKEFFSFRKNISFWLNIVAMVVVGIGFIFGVLEWLDVYTRHGETVTVPNVREMTVEEAEKAFRQEGLVCVISDTRYVKNLAAGIVLDMKPNAGEKVKEGRTIYLTINTREVPLRAVPDVADNSSFRQAEAKLQSVGFKLTEVQLIPGEKDWVYGVKYQDRELSAGEKVPVGAALTLIVGDGLGELSGDSLNVDSLQIQAEPSAPVHEESWF